MWTFVDFPFVKTTLHVPQFASKNIYTKRGGIHTTWNPPVHPAIENKSVRNPSSVAPSLECNILNLLEVEGLFLSSSEVLEQFVPVSI